MMRKSEQATYTETVDTHIPVDLRLQTSNTGW